MKISQPERRRVINMRVKTRVKSRIDNNLFWLRELVRERDFNVAEYIHAAKVSSGLENEENTTIAIRCFVPRSISFDPLPLSNIFTYRTPFAPGNPSLCQAVIKRVQNRLRKSGRIEREIDRAVLKVNFVDKFLYPSIKGRIASAVERKAFKTRLRIENK